MIVQLSANSGERLRVNRQVGKSPPDPSLGGDHLPRQVQADLGLEDLVRALVDRPEHQGGVPSNRVTVATWLNSTRAVGLETRAKITPVVTASSTRPVKHSRVTTRLA